LFSQAKRPLVPLRGAYCCLIAVCLGGCGKSAAVSFHGQLASAASEARRFIAEWHCEQAEISPAPAWQPPFRSCSGAIADTTFWILTSAGDTVVSLAKQTVWDASDPAMGATEWKRDLETRYGAGEPWCDSSLADYQRMWRHSGWYEVLVINSRKAIANYSATLGDPYCTPTESESYDVHS
jgi:hypothetical protein